MHPRRHIGGKTALGFRSASGCLTSLPQTLTANISVDRTAYGVRSPLRYVAWPMNCFVFRAVVWLCAGFEGRSLTHALVAPHAPVGRGQLGRRSSSELGLALEAS